MVSCLSLNFPTAVLTCMGLACRIDHAEKQAARCNYEQGQSCAGRSMLTDSMESIC